MSHRQDSGSRKGTARVRPNSEKTVQLKEAQWPSQRASQGWYSTVQYNTVQYSTVQGWYLVHPAQGEGHRQPGVAGQGALGHLHVLQHCDTRIKFEINKYFASNYPPRKG